MTTLLDLIAHLHQLKAEAKAIQDDEELPLSEKRKLNENNESEAMNTLMAIGGISLVDLHSVAASLKDIADSLRAIANNRT